MREDPDRRRRVPRTDTLLDDPRLTHAAGRLGRDLVKDAVRRVQQSVRDGALEPADAVEAALPALPGGAGLAPGGSNGSRGREGGGVGESGGLWGRAFI